jgi:hypothetical protein
MLGAALDMKEGANDPMSLSGWLAAEIAAVEALLRDCGPLCRLDRRRAAPTSAKESEGRYFVLRRAARLLGSGAGLEPLAKDVKRAHAFLVARGGAACNREWKAYFTGMLDAARALQAKAGVFVVPESAHTPECQDILSELMVRDIAEPTHSVSASGSASATLVAEPADAGTMRAPARRVAIRASQVSIGPEDPARRQR